MIRLIQDLYTYNTWATKQVLAAAGELTVEQRDTKLPSLLHGSINLSFLHILNTQRTWNALLREQKPAPNLMSVLGLREVSDLWSIEDDYTLALITKSLRNNDGVRRMILMPDQNCWSIWRILTHLALYLEVQRSYIVLAIRALGGTIGEVDYMHYLIEEEGN